MLSFWPFHRHHWKPIAVDHFYRWKTLVLCECSCGHNTVKTRRGSWTLEQIREAWGA